MSSNEGGQSVKEQYLEILTDHAQEINDYSEEIEYVFRDTVGSDRLHNNFNDYFDTMRSALYGRIDPGEEGLITEAILNIVINYDEDIYDSLYESNEQLAATIRELANKHGLDANRRYRRVIRGTKYWSNIRSEIGIRSSEPKFRHELTIDYTDRIEFDSQLNSTMILARHFLQQLMNSPNALGNDVLGYLEEETAEEVKELSESLLELIQEYESETRDEAQDVNDSSLNDTG